MSEPVVVPLFEVVLLRWVKLLCASCHDLGVSADSICHVEVVNSIGKQTVVQLPIVIGSVGKLIERAASFDVIILNKVRSKLSNSSAHFIE